MKIDRIMIAATKSGSGKTTVTCALLKTIKNRGIKAAAFKSGPDYIDTMFHEKVLGIPSANLDTFFTGEKLTRELFARHAAGAKMAVLEGVMGVYDGLGGIREEGSSYHLAKVTGTPIVLVADVKGMGYSILPMLAGFLSYDTEHLIKGVILNRISRGYYEIIKPLIEDNLPLSVVGFLPEKKEFCLESRHLGLVTPKELKNIEEKLAEISGVFEESVSIPAILKIAGNAENMGGIEFTGNTKEAGSGRIRESAGKGMKCGEKSLAIAVARDEAFCFYYKDNLLLLEESGARIIYFSPLYDKKIPEGCQGLLLGGGYPELYADKISKNVSMRLSVKRVIETGIPVVAECGGFMYLHSALTDKNGIRYAMAGVIPAECFYTGKPVRFGYIDIREKKSNFLPENETIKGHEFHYYDSTYNGDNAFATKPVTGKSYSCVITGGNCWMGFPHLYYPSNPAFARAFVQKARKYKEIR